MKKENILTSFKRELGYVNATNQYIELLIRLSIRDYGSSIENDLPKLAKSVKLNVSNLAENYTKRISKSYIINIHACFENFLKSFKELAGTPTNIVKGVKPQDESWLEWTLKIADLTNEQEISNDIIICEYYRLIRNNILHYNFSNNVDIKYKWSQINKIKNPRLQAPNEGENISFDDQVLFSRATYNVADYIFKHSQYDIDSIVDKYKEDLIKLVKPLQENNSRIRAAKKIEHYFEIMYPVLTDVNWEQEVDKLFN